MNFSASSSVADANGDLSDISSNGSVLELTNVGTMAAPAIYPSAPNILSPAPNMLNAGLTVDANGDVIGTTGYFFPPVIGPPVDNPPGNYGTVFEIKNLGTVDAPGLRFFHRQLSSHLHKHVERTAPDGGLIN